MTRYGLAFAAALALAGTLHAAETKVAPTETKVAPTKPAAVTTADPYQWLEDISGAKAMDWVKARNAEIVKGLASTEPFKQLQEKVLEVLDSDARIPYVQRMGDSLYNFWRDKQHPRGLWRRTTLAEYKKPHPRWTVLIDVDALNKKEKENWVWKGADCLKPAYRHCMVGLSRGGADARVMREYDLARHAFVKNGFTLAEAKSSTSWIDDNTLFVGTDFGPGSMTKSSYPRIAKRWRRGTPLDAATLVYEGTTDDMNVAAFHDATPGFARDLVFRAIDFWHSETYVLDAAGKLVLIDVPKDAETDINREWLLIRTRSPWTVSGKTWPPGSLLAARLDDYLAGKRELTQLFAPTPTTSLAGYSWTRHHLLLNELQDVAGRIEVLTPAAGAWKREPLAGTPALSTVDAYGSDADRTDEYFLNRGWIPAAEHARPRRARPGGGADAQAHAGFLRRLGPDGDPLLRALQGRRAHPLLRHRAQGDGGQRPAADAAVRLRRLRGVADALVQRHHRSRLAGARRRLRRRQHPRRRRIRSRLAHRPRSSRTGCAPTRTSPPSPRICSPRRSPHRRTSASKAGATAGCSWATC